VTERKRERETAQISTHILIKSPRRYPYFDVVVGLVRSHDPESYMLAVAYATGRASHARQVKGDDPDKKGYPGPPGWGFGVGLTTPPNNKKNYWCESRAKEKAG